MAHAGLVDKRINRWKFIAPVRKRGTACTYDLVWRTAPARVVLNLKNSLEKN